MSLLMQLPQGLERRFEALCLGLVEAGHARGVDFSKPFGEEALVARDSVSWRVFKNPVSVFIGGVAAVILELAEPSVRTGVWEHSTFLKDPVGRLRRTGLAAMVTVYAARSVSKPIIARVTRMHASVRGATPSGIEFSAMDADLLSWVQATAGYGFLTGYSRYTGPLDPCDADRFYREGLEAAHLYGAADAPGSAAALEARFDSMRTRLEGSAIVLQFLDIISRVPVVPRPLLGVQRMLVRAAVDILPGWVRTRLGLDERHVLRPFESTMVKALARLADRVVLPGSAPAQSCVRLGLPPGHLYG